MFDRNNADDHKICSHGIREYAHCWIGWSYWMKIGMWGWCRWGWCWWGTDWWCRCRWYRCRGNAENRHDTEKWMNNKCTRTHTKPQWSTPFRLIPKLKEVACDVLLLMKDFVKERVFFDKSNQTLREKIENPTENLTWVFENWEEFPKQRGDYISSEGGKSMFGENSFPNGRDACSQGKANLMVALPEGRDCLGVA